MAKQSLVREFVLFIKVEKKYWMIPLILVLLMVCGLVVLAGSPAGPFMYPFGF